jgi:PAS domain S-box-containing protein
MKFWSRQSALVAGKIATAGDRHSAPIRLLVFCGMLLVAAVAISAGLILSNLHSRALADSERELENIALVLAEQIDRTFQALDLVQTSLIERMKTLGITSTGDYERQMSSQDIHLTLKDKIASLPQVDAVILINSNGKVTNFSRYWPIPTISVADREHFKVFQSDAQLTSYVSKPERNRATGTWTMYLARKLTAPNGELLGLVTGAMELAYFEKFFGSIALGPDGAISLFRRDGILLARYPQRDLPGSSYGQGALFETVLSRANKGTIRLTSIIDGKERLIAGHSLAHYPVVVAVGTTVAAALADWRHLANYLIGAATLTIIVIAGIIILSVRQFKNFELLVQARAEKVEAEKVRQQKLQLDAALNNMRQGLLLFDSESRLVLCNQRYLKMYGLSPETTRPGCTLRDLLCQRKAVGTFKGDPDQYIAKLVDYGKVETKVVQLPDGRMISVTNAPAQNGGWVSTHDDVTEQRRVEKELDRSQNFLNTIIENVPAPIFVKEASGLRYVLINRAGENFWGISRDKMIGKTSHEIFAKEEADLIAARDEQLLRSDQSCFDEREICTPRNGIRSIVSKRLVVSDADGKS